jgi:hypothetical protein
MFHLAPKYWKSLGANQTAVVQRIHQAGLRTFTATPTQLDPSVAEQTGLYNAGIDIVYTYGTVNGVKARDAINEQRGVSNGGK